MGTPDTLTARVILFDGVCNLCNRSVQFIIKRDSKSRFQFSPLQSKFATTKIEELSIPSRAMESIILIHDKKYYQRSRAVLEIVRHLNGLWPAFYVFIIIPSPIRDWLYNIIASRRYRWFGRQDSCMIPTPSLKARFLE